MVKKQKAAGNRKNSKEGKSLLRKIEDKAIGAIVTAVVTCMAPYLLPTRTPAPPPPPPPIVIIMSNDSQTADKARRIQHERSYVQTDVPASNPPMKAFRLTLIGQGDKAMEQYDFLASMPQVSPTKVIDRNVDVTGSASQKVKSPFYISYQAHPEAPEFAVQADRDQFYNTFASLAEPDRKNLEQSLEQVKGVKITIKGDAPAPNSAPPNGTDRT